MSESTKANLFDQESWPGCAATLIGTLVLTIAVGCERSSPVAPSATGAESNRARDTPSAEPPRPGQLFTDVTESLGFEVPTRPWPDGQFMTPEVTPGGIAVFDFDGDQRLDIYQVCHCPAGSFTESAPNRLFRQQADGRFAEVPKAAGLDDPGFGHGVAVGDIDNDGDLDVYVTNYGPDALYRNDGSDGFVDVTESAGIVGDHWTSSAGFLDYDRDGDLDLYVVNFATFDPDRRCLVGDDHNDPDYCGPHDFDGLLDTLYRNNGDGTFTNVTDEAGIAQPGRGWGLACADFTQDGWCDVYVANDAEPAQLWVNQQDGTFEEEAVLRGCAYNADGRVEAGMGVAAADVDIDGKLDLFKTHISGETNTLYLTGTAHGTYTDRTTMARTGAVDRPYTGWGCAFFDYDHDGDLDLAVANGRVGKGVGQKGSSLGAFWSRFAEPNLLFANNGQGTFENTSTSAGEFGRQPLVSRGLACGDLDQDGDLDMVVQNVDNSLRIYRNDAPSEDSHWLLVHARTGNRDAYGAQITVEAGGRRLIGLAHPTYSYLASNDPRAHFGLGDAEQIDSFTVDWPSGRRERFDPPSVDRVVEITEGEGETIED